MELSDQEFSQLVQDGIDNILEKFKVLAKNVVIVWAEEPTDEQLKKSNLRRGQGLFGLYEGVPQIARGAGYSAVPDKITIFKMAILNSCVTIEQAKKQVAETVWHELAHHFGSSENRVQQAQLKRRRHHQDAGS